MWPGSKMGQRPTHYKLWRTLCDIKRADTFANTLHCEECGSTFSRPHKLRSNKCEASIKCSKRFIGKAFRASNAVFDKMFEQTGKKVGWISSTFNLGYLMTLSVYFILTTYQLKLKPVVFPELTNMVICSNVPGFQEPVHFVKGADDNGAGEIA